MKILTLILSSLFLVACGGGSGSSTTEPTTGQFKDSNTQGLSYTSGVQSDITNENGEFTYEVGKSVSFSVGGIALGSSTGKAIITPVDLVENAGATSTAVTNIVRLLTSLDADGNLNNGINILPEVAGYIEEAGLTLDFAADTFTLNDVITEVNGRQSSRTYTAVDTNTAQEHLLDTLRCSYVGGYVGKINNSNAPTDDFGAIIHRDGTVQLIIQDEDKSIQITDASSPIDFSQNPLSVIVPETGVVNTVTFNDVNNLTGTSAYDSTIDNFSASRIGGTLNAKYRFTGAFSGTEFGIFTFDISEESEVTGSAYSVSKNQTFVITGTASGNNLNAIIDNNQSATITATINLNSGTISDGLWNSSGSGTFIGSGCTLN